jgi:hypothetical protein
MRNCDYDLFVQLQADQEGHTIASNEAGQATPIGNRSRTGDYDIFDKTSQHLRAEVHLLSTSQKSLESGNRLELRYKKSVPAWNVLEANWHFACPKDYTFVLPRLYVHVDGRALVQVRSVRELGDVHLGVLPAQKKNAFTLAWEMEQVKSTLYL